MRVLCLCCFIAALAVAPAWAQENPVASFRTTIVEQAEASLTQALKRNRHLQPTTTASAIPAGTYTVGAGGDYPTLQSAFDVLSGGGIAGSVTFLLTDQMYFAPLGPITLTGPVRGAGPASRITLRPAEGVDVTIRGNGEGALALSNVSYFTLSGLGEKKAAPMSVVAHVNEKVKDDARCSVPVAVIGSCTDVRIQDLAVHSDNLSVESIGVLLAADAAGSPAQCAISGVAVEGASIGLCVVGLPGGPRPTDVAVRGNRIAGVKGVPVAVGIQDQFATGTIIENNHIEHLRGTLPDRYEYQVGISLYGGTNTVVRNNVVRDLFLESGNARVCGILASGTLAAKGSGVKIYNNMIYGIGVRTAESGSQDVAGIRAGYQSTLDVDYNTIQLTGGGDHGKSTGSAALWCDPSTASASVRSNIMINTRDDTPGRSLGMLADAKALLSRNNNIVVGSCAEAFLVQRRRETFKTLGEWAESGCDECSRSMMISFMPPDLHINVRRACCCCMDGCGVPVEGIGEDIDGQPRNPTSPDIGADEFVADVKDDRHPTAYEEPQSVGLSDSYPNPFNPTTVFRFALPNAVDVHLAVYNALGQEVSELVRGECAAGIHEVVFDGSHLPAGAYFARLKAANVVQIRKILLVK